MLGRTHMAIGAVGAVVAAPFFLHSDWIPVTYEFSHSTALQTVLHEGLFVAGSVLGSSMPDLDEQHSLLARKVERLAQIAIVILLAAVIMLLHMSSSKGAWLFVFAAAATITAQANLARKVALGLLAAGSVYVGSTGEIPMISGVLLAIWSIGAMLTSHRTFTHSILGLATFSYAAYLAATHFGMRLLGTGIFLGYALHMIADAISGGVPFLWPLSLNHSGKATREGIRLVHTGGMADHLIGAVSVIGFVILAFK